MVVVLDMYLWGKSIEFRKKGVIEFFEICRLVLGLW